MENTIVGDVTGDPFEANVFKEVDANNLERCCFPSQARRRSIHGAV